MTTRQKTKVKICGIKDDKNLNIAIKAGTDFIGFVFYPPSPRYVEPRTALKLAEKLPKNINSVALFVNPADEDLIKAKGLDMIQLHGNETPQRVMEIKDLAGCHIIKALRIGKSKDLEQITPYEDSADWLLFDAKPTSTQGDVLPGGTGKSFDWSLLYSINFKKPWMLSGGLNTKNVKRAISQLSPDAVDVSSGVEGRRGKKDAEKIQIFIETVKNI